ncbi:MAG: hypothetical protein IPJ66_14250 [Bacteroidetes bacterium]|nr:hypothetical protein [Bacteroidota bacterium]
MKIAFEKLKADSSNKKLQSEYITAFPSDTKTFLNVFQTEKFDQLYNDSEKYLDALVQCAIYYPKEVISKCVDLGKNLIWDADAVGQLQRMTVDLAVKNPNTFLAKYKTLNTKEQTSLINFLADVENHDAYKEYQDIIDKMQIIGQTEISNKLELARTERKKRRDH